MMFENKKFAKSTFKCSVFLKTINNLMLLVDAYNIRSGNYAREMVNTVLQWQNSEDKLDAMPSFIMLNLENNASLRHTPN